MFSLVYFGNEFIKRIMDIGIVNKSVQSQSSCGF